MNKIFFGEKKKKVAFSCTQPANSEYGHVIRAHEKLLPFDHTHIQKQGLSTKSAIQRAKR